MQAINENNIPQELKDRKAWVLWKYLINGGEKRKCLFQTCGATAKTNDPSTWDTFETVKQRFAAGNWEGIGYVFSPDDPYTGIDLDGCRNPETKVTEQWAKDIITELSSYAELSPSMSGVKIWVRAKFGLSTGKKVPLPDMPKVCDKEPGIEVYDWGRFFTVTGVVLKGQTAISDRQDVLDSLQQRFFPVVSRAARTPSDFKSESSIIERARKYVAKMPPSVSGQNGSDAAFRVACVLVLGFGLSIDDAKDAIQDWNAACQPPWSDKDIEHKLDGADQRGGERGYLRNVAPDNYAAYHQRCPLPDYTEAEPARVPEEHGPQESPIIVTTMEEASRKYLAAVSAGKVRLLDLGLAELDYAIGGGVEPGEMIIFAARPSHGKSMASQQVAHNFTARGTPVVFVSEEMSSMALGKRVIQFVSDVPAESWEHRTAAVNSQLDSHFKERAPCYILEQCRSADRVATEISRFVKDKGVGLAIVDYAQLLTGKGKGRYEEITNVSIALKQVGSECKIPIIVLCQMSRAIESRTDFVPLMSDLKESGQFEQDADVIIFQVWPHRINRDKPFDKYMLYVAKNRNRPVNESIVECRFVPSRQMILSEKPKGPAQADWNETEDAFEEIRNIEFGP